jgi:RNA polymerase sigma-70 factor, ECF subfamily
MSRRRPRREPQPGRSHADHNADVLASLAARGDRDAFAELCQGIHHDVWRYCWSLTGDRHLADDATQETFLRATTAIRRFRGDAPVRVWFVVLARRSVGAILERHKRTPIPAEPVHLPVRDATGFVDLGQLIGELTADARQAFVLTQMLGFSYADAATAMGCPVGTIRSRVFRAKVALVDAYTDAHTQQPPTTEEACE